MKKITILLLTTVVIATGCKRFTDINQNPNQPTSVTPNVLLSAALAASGNSVGTDWFNEARWIGYWSRSGNYIATIPVEQYNITTSFEDGSWQDLYGTLSKYNNIQKSAASSPSTLSFYLGVAETMEALHFSNLVDGFGNIPYSQAFNINKYVTPKYDDAATVYASLIIKCDSAVTYFKQAAVYYQTASGTVISTDDKYDIMFGRGQGVAPATRMANWIAFANTVKLKLLMNEVAVASGSVAGELAKTTGGYLTPGITASVNPGYSAASAAQLSPFYGAFINNAGNTTVTDNFNRANTYAVNFYKATNDTYRPQLAYAALSGGVIGSAYDGDPNAGSDATTSGVGPGLLKGPSQDQVIMTDFEGLFTEAEAAQRGYNVGNDATTLLKQAVEQNFIFLGDNAADADAYILANAGNPNVDIAAGGLQAILTQKWIALNGVDWFQAYTDFRRSGYPTYNFDGSGFFGPSHAPQHVQHNGKAYIPYRFLYPQSEFDTNGSNVPPGITPYTPIFWDKREN